MRFILPMEKIREVMEKGYKNFKIVRKKGHSIEFCDVNKDVCVNVGSARTFEGGYYKFCVNTSRARYPYQPSLPVCFKTKEEAISYAAALMEGINEFGTRYLSEEKIADILVDMMEDGEAFVCSLPSIDDYERIPLDVAVSKKFKMNEKKRRANCMELERRALGLSK